MFLSSPFSISLCYFHYLTPRDYFLAILHLYFLPRRRRFLSLIYFDAFNTPRGIHSIKMAFASRFGAVTSTPPRVLIITGLAGHFSDIYHLVIMPSEFPLTLVKVRLAFMPDWISIYTLSRAMMLSISFIPMLTHGTRCRSASKVIHMRWRSSRWRALRQLRCWLSNVWYLIYINTSLSLMKFLMIFYVRHDSFLTICCIVLLRRLLLLNDEPVAHLPYTQSITGASDCHRWCLY